MNLSWLQSTVELALIFSLVALSLHLTYRLMKYPDLTVDGSFPLGAACAAWCCYQGVNPCTTLVVCTLAGMLAGVCTGVLHKVMGVPDILAAILTMTALYSINLRIMSGPNLPLIGQEGYEISLHFLIPVVAACYFSIKLFLSSRVGLQYRAAGDNPVMARSKGINTDLMVVLALALGNGLAALSGCLFAQSIGLADVNLGVGTIIIGLASLICAESLPLRKLPLIALLLGALIYRLIMASALSWNILAPGDLNLLSAALVVLLIVLVNKNKKEQTA